MNGLVSIGLPAFNSAETLNRAITGLREQTHENLQIIISDNASTDDTLEVAHEAAESDRRIEVVTSPMNLGAQLNFKRVMDLAKGDFFMWAGSDDIHLPEFVSSNLRVLLASDRVAGSISQVRWLIDGIPGELAAGTRPLIGRPRQNVAEYLRRARDNSRFYSLFRKEVLVRSFPDRRCFGFDIAAMASTLRFGSHQRVDEVLLLRERTPPGSYAGLVEGEATSFSERVVPFLPASLEIVRSVPMGPSAAWWLVCRNAYEHARYWSTTETVYGTVLKRLSRPLDAARRRAVLDRD